VTDLAEVPTTPASHRPLLQLLDPDGVLLRGEVGADVTPELVCGRYRDMVLARQFDQEAFHLQRQGELGLWLSCRGRRRRRSAVSVRCVRRIRCSRRTGNRSPLCAAESGLPSC
jgi:2-oxoisovalerate dehydrogenase E1 component alpha subunit